MLSGSRDDVSTPLTAGSVESLNDLLAYNHHRYPRANLLNHKVGGEWRSISSMEMARRVHCLALGLYALGVRKGDTVGLFSENGPDWIICDYAMFACGAVSVPLYVTQIVPQIENILSAARASVLFISSKQLCDRIEPVLAKLPLKHIITFSAFTQADRVITLAEVESLGDRLSTEQPGLYEALRTSVRADDLASLVYTSGTTAMPKGVQLTHRNLLSNAIDAGEGVEWHPETDSAFSFLPLSHIFERTVINIYLFHGLPIYFAETIDTVVQNLQEIRPTILATVPRVLEKVYDRILAAGTNLAGIKRRLFFSSLELAKSFDPEVPEGLLMRLRHGLYSTLVFSKWRNALGGRVRLIISGGAALDPRLARIFFAAGMPVMQGYGLTETSPVIAVNTVARNRIGTVGMPLRNVEVRIANDGEILVRGPNVMRGFHDDPQATKEVFEGDWFKTGDIGSLDHDGFLALTGRKRDLIKKSSGKFIAPGPIEAEFLTCRFVEHAVVVGEGRKFAIVIIVPNFANLEGWAKDHGISYASRASLVACLEVRAVYAEEIDRVNRALNNWERIVDFILSDEELSVSTGHLTPTFKLRRAVVAKTFHKQINALYAKYESTWQDGEGKRAESTAPLNLSSTHTQKP